jgi:GT2 family glycosyltransferase
MDKLNLGFVFTNFNNSQLTLNALKSIKEGFIGGEYSVVVVDNDSSEIEKKILADGVGCHPDVQIIFNNKNVGYFNGLNIGINSLRENKSKLQFIVVGNNDLTFESTFFSAMALNVDAIKQYFVVCPDLITSDGIHQNPHVINTISRFREIVWDVYYSNYKIAKIISYAASKLQGWVARQDFVSHEESRYIHQGYGACYILTPKFFDKFQDLWSPSFLMGEEFYLALQLESVNSMMFYYPKLKVLHHDHATVSQLLGRTLWGYSKEAHGIYRHFISPYRLKMRKPETMNSFISKQRW